MKHVVWATLAASSIALGQADPEGRIRFSGLLRTRVEGWNWFESSAADNRYGYSGSQLRLQWTQQQRRFGWTVELMAPILLGLPAQSLAPSPQGALGAGANYFQANNNSRNAAMLFPKQAFVQGKLGRHGLRLGRFEWADGTELTPVDPSLAALKRERIAQRLLAPFAWTHVGRSFDGAHYTWDRRQTNITVTAAMPTRGVFQADGWGRVNTAFLYSSITHGLTGRTTSADLRAFAAVYHDWRSVLKTDSRPIDQRRSDTGNIQIWSFGGHAIAKRSLPLADLDLMFWGLGQTGRWGQLAHRAGSTAIEFGVQPVWSRQRGLWLRSGWNHGSGDRDAADNRHGTFFQLLPTPRPYARFPFFNLMNSQDGFFEFRLKPAKPVQLRADFHWLRLAHSSDLWMMGGGAFQPWTFGYVGRPAQGARGLANLYDISVDWTISRRTAISIYLGYADPRGAIRAAYPEAQLGALGFIELTQRF